MSFRGERKRAALASHIASGEYCLLRLELMRHDERRRGWPVAAARDRNRLQIRDTFGMA